jgi:hypothetical protein
VRPNTWALAKLVVQTKILKHVRLTLQNAKRKKKVVLAAKTNINF